MWHPGGMSPRTGSPGQQTNRKRSGSFVRSFVGRPGRTLCAAVGTCGDNMWTRHMCHASSTDNARGHMCACALVLMSVVRGEGMCAHNAQKHIW